MQAIRKRHVEEPKGASPTRQNPPIAAKEPASRGPSQSPVRKAIVRPDYWTPDASKLVFCISLLAFVIRFAMVNEPTEVV